MSKKTYHGGKLKPIIQIVARLVQVNPTLADDPGLLYATVATHISEIKETEKCANCGASMLEYIFEFDVLDALLLIAMGKEVQRQLQEGIPFTEANKVRIQHLNVASYAMKSRTTQMSKLGLVAKYKGSNGRHLPGHWVVTKRGFEALAGKLVPKSVRVWRGHIEERPDHLTTLTEALNSHRDKVVSQIRRGKNVKTDYRNEIAQYKVEDWVHFAGVHEGRLF